MKTQILLLLLVAASMQCYGSHHGRNHGRYHRPYDYYHRRHDSSEKHRHHNNHDFPDSFEYSSQDLEDNVNSNRTPRSEMVNLVVDLKPKENTVKDGILNGNKSAMDMEADKKAYDMDKGYSGTRIDDISLGHAEPNNVNGDAGSKNVNEISLNSNDIKSDGTISANEFSPNGGNVGNNLESNLGDLGDHNFGGNSGVNLGDNLGFPLVNKPGLRLGGNLGVPFGGNLGVNLRGFPRFPTFGVKDFHTIPYLRLGGNREVPLGGYLGLPLNGNSGANLESNQGLSLGDNSGVRLGGNLDKPLERNLNGNIRGNNLDTDPLSINSLSSLENLIDNNEKNIINVDNGKLALKTKDMDNLKQNSKTIDDIKQNTEYSIGNGDHERVNAGGEYNNNELKPNNNNNINGLFPEDNDSNDNRADGELPSNNNNLNVDNPGTDNYNDNKLPNNAATATTDKDKAKPKIDAHSSNTDEISISPENDNKPNTRPTTGDNHPTEISSIETPDKEEDGVSNQLEMIPVLLPGGGYVLLPSSILSNMPSYIVVMINGQPTLLQNPGDDINGGSLDLSNILASGLSISGAVLPSWNNIGVPAGDGGDTIGKPNLQQHATPVWVGGSDATISLLAKPYSGSIPFADSIRPILTLPISVPGMIDPGFSPSFWNNGFWNKNHNLQNSGPDVDWGNQIDSNTNYPYPAVFYPHYPSTYPDDNNDSSHQKDNKNPNDISSTDPRKPYPNVSLKPRPDFHLDISEGKPPEANHGLYSQLRSDIGVNSHLYTHPFFPQNDFHEPNPDVSIETDHGHNIRTEPYPESHDNKLDDPGRDNWDDKSIERDITIESSEEDRDDTDHEQVKWTEYRPDHRDNNRIENHLDHRDDKWNKVHANYRHDGNFGLHPNDGDDTKIRPYPGHGDNKSSEPHRNHWDDKNIDPHPLFWDDESREFHPDDRDNERIVNHPDYRDDKTIEPHTQHWDDERIDSNPDYRDDKRVKPHSDHLDDKKIVPHPDQRDDGRIKFHPDHRDEDDKRIESDPDLNIPLKHHLDSQTDDPMLTHTENLPNILFLSKQTHRKPLEDISGFHFTLPRPAQVDKSEKTSLVNGLIDSLNILLKYPNRDDNQSKEVRSLIKLLLAILKPGDKNLMLVPKLNDDAEDELDQGNINHLLLHLLKGYYEPNLKILLDPSLDESTRTNLILLLKLLANNQDSSAPKGTENPLLYFLGQIPCDLSKKQEEYETLSSKLLQLLADDYDRGDPQTRLERTVARGIVSEE